MSKEKLIKLTPYLYFLGLVLLIILPLLKGGFLLSLDHIFAPKFKIPQPPIDEIYLTHWFFFLTSKVIPSFILEKIWLFLILFLSVLGAYHLLPTKSFFGKIFAGTFYLFNPFVYNRLLLGQWRLLTAYALLPFLIKLLFSFKDKPNLKNSLKFVLILSLISFFHLRALTIVFVILVVFILLNIYEKLHNKNALFALLKYYFLILGGFLLVNSYWIISLLRNQTLPRFNVDLEHIFAFQTIPDSKLGLFFNIFSLYGFWGEKGFHYQNLKDLIFGWQFLAVLIWILVSLGIYFGIKQRKTRFLATFFLVLIPIAAIFSAGVAFAPLKSFHLFLERNFFVFEGLRESYKFSQILALAFAFLGGLGIEYLIKTLKSEKFLKTGFTAVFLFLPLFYSWGLFWAGHGQIKTYQYPSSWYQVNEILNEDKSNFKVLSLPWHRYLSFSFTPGKIIENPSKIFFDKETISSDNLEFAQIYTQSQNPTSKFIEAEIVNFKEGDISEKLNQICVKYVILVQEADFENYKFLERKLTKVHEENDLILYRNSTFNCQSIST